MYRHPSCQSIADDGFVHIHQALPSDEVKHILETCRPIYESALASSKSRPRETVPYASLVVNHWELAYLIDRPEVLRPVIALLGPCIHMIASEFWVREARTGSPDLAEGVHQDGGFLMHHLPCVTQVKAQFFLTPLKERGMGNLGFIRGSHRWTELPDDLPPEQVEQNRVVTTPDAGDAVIWTNRTFHFVENNDSGWDRISIILTYSPIWARPFDYVQVSAEAASRFTPLQRLLVGDDGEGFYRAKYYNPPLNYLARYQTLLTENLGPLSHCFDTAKLLYNFSPGRSTPEIEPVGSP